MGNKKSDQEIAYVTKEYDMYKCMVCGKIYKTSEPMPTKGFGDGCCTIGSLTELKK